LLRAERGVTGDSSLPSTATMVDNHVNAKQKAMVENPVNAKKKAETEDPNVVTEKELLELKLKSVKFFPS
jgi:hypothetical protein